MKEEHVVQQLAALAQPTRLAIHRLLIRHVPDGVAAGAIAAELGLAPATLSFHLKEMLRAGLLSSEQQGRFVLYRADIGAMNGLIAYLTESCCVAATSESRDRCCPSLTEPEL
ncbi:ArsR/SmtB family transcription factor [Chitinibacteraceae bacterium HSL-7]